MTMDLIGLDDTTADNVIVNDIIKFVFVDEDGETFEDILRVEITGIDETRVILVGLSDYHYGARETYELDPDLKVTVLGYE